MKTPQKRSSRPRAPVRKAAQLEAKLQPSQKRAKSTFETILDVTGRLLGEVGVERLSTNMICERAGMTPPALYRWFPNKYAILAELARRLSTAQLEAVGGLWQERVEPAETFPEAANEIAEVLKQLNKITQSRPGGIWIMRAMRAVPMLRDIRMAFRTQLAAIIRDGLRARGVRMASEEDLDIAAHLIAETILAADEMATEGPASDVDAIAREIGWMIELYARERWGSPQ
ncbi:TetR/AcrR family transcriptional regulator [Chelativorans salis]|uniref:TetR/AcrR family transcriptional regulator n=1 Tax=Chelativorans salis TaxID=2978478 RepID=A0ABT2LTH0_9HYPH|nr:TetR/AcrR family transcriptional regulator [Chelativorans sp. EGI FJ00035]MCT7377656.1 TetR/AcrR family transcriptional regulator [Chelativorans sp. EGI FJ00035]